LPAIAKAGDGEAQALHPYAPWSVEAVRTRRQELLAQALCGRAFVLCIDETGDRKQGYTTDDVASQAIGNLGKTAHGMVSVNAYGVLDQIRFPLSFQVYTPRTRLYPDAPSFTKPHLALQRIQALPAQGFACSVVLADSR
jgi:SRSO17 transposase